MGKSFILVVVAGTLLAGCSSPQQRSEIYINTVPPGASCQVSRDGTAVATVDPTPGIALVDETSAAEASIRCRRSGFAEAAVVAPTHEGPTDFFGGGGRHVYDNPVTVTLTPLGAAGARR